LEKILVRRVRREKRTIDWKDSIYYYLRSRRAVWQGFQLEWTGAPSSALLGHTGSESLCVCNIIGCKQ